MLSAHETDRVDPEQDVKKNQQGKNNCDPSSKDRPPRIDRWKIVFADLVHQISYPQMNPACYRKFSLQVSVGYEPRFQLSPLECAQFTIEIIEKFIRIH